MKLNVVTCKDTLMNAFLQPKFIEKAPEDEFASSLRALFYADDNQLRFYQNYEFYFLGTFDDETGQFDPQVKCIGTFSDRVSQVLLSKGAKQDA